MEWIIKATDSTTEDFESPNQANFSNKWNSIIKSLVSKI